MKEESIIAKVENWFNQYMCFPDSNYAFVASLWSAATHCWPCFDVFPYLSITASTRQAGKTLFGIDLMKNVASNADTFSATSASSIFRIIADEHPTVLIDEAEALGENSADAMHELMNKGYKRGQTIKRTAGQEVKTFETFCPKVFVLIGDVNDTLRSRSIVFSLRRGTPEQLRTKKRYMSVVAENEGRELRETLHLEVESNQNQIIDAYASCERMFWLNARDEELWLPLFAVCRAICPERVEQLKRAAADMAAMKTAEKKNWTAEELRTEEESAQNLEFGEWLIKDMAKLMREKKQQVIFTRDLLELLPEISTSPWRKFKGVGLDQFKLSNLLDAYNVNSTTVSIGSGRKTRKQAQGYKLQDLKKAAEKAGFEL